MEPKGEPLCTSLARSKEKVNINAARDLMRLLGLLCLWQFQSLPYIRVCRRRLTILEVPIIFYLRSQLWISRW
jgi:hypothetical protein